MKNIYRGTLFFTAIIFALSLNCTIKYFDTNKLLNDYTTEGFLDRDHYQVIVKGNADKEARGLTASRESALKNAKAAMNEKIITSLVNYNINYHLNKAQIKNVNDVKNMGEAKKELSGKMQEFLQYGETAFEYYNHDFSAVLVYRLFKDGLAEKIESVKPSFVLREKEEKPAKAK
jgi:hypothetical protein